MIPIMQSLRLWLILAYMMRWVGRMQFQSVQYSTVGHGGVSGKSLTRTKMIPLVNTRQLWLQCMSGVKRRIQPDTATQMIWKRMRALKLRCKPLLRQPFPTARNLYLQLLRFECITNKMINTHSIVIISEPQHLNIQFWNVVIDLKILQRNYTQKVHPLKKVAGNIQNVDL